MLVIGVSIYGVTFSYHCTTCTLMSANEDKTTRQQMNELRVHRDCEICTALPT